MPKRTIAGPYLRELPTCQHPECNAPTKVELMTADSKRTAVYCTKHGIEALQRVR